MAIKFLHNLDLSQNQLLSALFQNENEAPASPKDGQVDYIDKNELAVSFAAKVSGYAYLS